jgi:UDP-MurNAc hydroxylase
MRITFLGHAGLFIETAAGTVLCDPWFTPAFFGSWFPFPRNDWLDRAAYCSPDFLYVSHEHRDHFDVETLRLVDKSATVLLPDFALGDHEAALRSLGFRSLVRLPRGMVRTVDGLRIEIEADTDEPTGDSALMLDDGQVRVLNQNDARPMSLERIQAFGPFDAHFLQFSGAMWFPAVYRWPARRKADLATRTRSAQTRRALAYVESVDAPNVFPVAGPPCFLDEELFHLNDLAGHAASIFPDQASFIESLEPTWAERCRLVFPGSVIELAPRNCRVEHPEPEDVLRQRIFVEKRTYLEEYAADMRPALEDMRQARRSEEVDILTSLGAWFDPLLEQGELTCTGVGDRVLLDVGDDRVVIDFNARAVVRDDGHRCGHRYYVPRWLVEALIREREVDWVNSLFLSCRFEAERDGPYNEWVYSFFKGLSPDRLRHLEFVYAAEPVPDEMFEIDGYLVQRRCPHFKADLKRFGHVQDGVLTCSMHGWQFDLATGRCLTAAGRRLHTRRKDA